MRIISGIHKGRKIYPPRHLPYRPTTDFAKTAIFNILANYFDFENCKVLDLFSGTGSISLEFSSRGSKDITAIDRHPGCVAFLKETAKKFNIEEIRAHKWDVFQFLNACYEKYDLIFAGPPYALKNIEDIPKIIFAKNFLKQNGWLIVEHNVKLSLDHIPNLIDKRNYGTTIFSIFANK